MLKPKLKQMAAVAIKGNAFQGKFCIWQVRIDNGSSDILLFQVLICGIIVPQGLWLQNLDQLDLLFYEIIGNEILFYAYHTNVWYAKENVKR